MHVAGIACTATGMIIVSDTLSHSIYAVHATTEVVTRLAGAGTRALPSVKYPVDFYNKLISNDPERLQSRIPRVGGFTNGDPLTEATFHEIVSIAIIESERCLAAADQLNHAIRKIPLSDAFFL